MTKIITFCFKRSGVFFPRFKADVTQPGVHGDTVDESLLWVRARQLMDRRAPAWPCQGTGAAITVVHVGHPATRGLMQRGLAAPISCTTESDTKTLRDPGPVPLPHLSCLLASPPAQVSAFQPPWVTPAPSLPGESCPLKVQPQPSSCLGQFLTTCPLHQAELVVPSLAPKPFVSTHPFIHSFVHEACQHQPPARPQAT